MRYTQRSFSTVAGGRSPDVCAAAGQHGGRDLRGRCSFCGTPIPAPAELLEAYGAEFDRLTSTPTHERPAE